MRSYLPFTKNLKPLLHNTIGSRGIPLNVPTVTLLAFSKTLTGEQEPSLSLRDNPTCNKIYILKKNDSFAHRNKHLTINYKWEITHIIKL